MASTAAPIEAFAASKGEWKVIDSTHMGSTLSLGEAGAVIFSPPSNAVSNWRGEGWHARNEISKATRDDGPWLYNFPLGRLGPQLLVRLRSQSGDDELCFEGDIMAGGVEGSLIFKGTCTRRNAKFNTPGDLRRYMHSVEGPFVAVRRTGSEAS